MRLAGLVTVIPCALAYCVPANWQHVTTLTNRGAARGIAELLRKQQHKGCILTSEEHCDQKVMVRRIALYLRTHSCLSDALRWEPHVTHLTHLDSEFGVSLDEVSEIAAQYPGMIVFADFGNRVRVSPRVLPEFLYHVHVTAKGSNNVIIKYRSPSE